jgi:hypothetical protein
MYLIGGKGVRVAINREIVPNIFDPVRKSDSDCRRKPI